MTLVTRSVSQPGLSYPSQRATEPSVLSPYSWPASMCPLSQVIPSPLLEPTSGATLQATFPSCPAASPETLLGVSLRL